MPASSATLITDELDRIVAVSSSNQTTSAAKLNWLITQLTFALCTLKKEKKKRTAVIIVALEIAGTR